MLHITKRGGLGLLIGLAAVPREGRAQPAASRPVTMTVAFPPGGDADASARIVAERLAQRLGRPVVVENRSGASGAVGAVHVARQAPDGGALFNSTSSLPIVPHVLRSAGYDPITDFTPIALIGTSPLLLMASRSSGLRSLEDVVAAARAGRVANYGTPGAGSPMHFLGAMFNRSAGIQLADVAYRGIAPMINDVVSGTLALGIANPGAVMEHLRAGTIIPIAISERQRSPLVPEVPTFAEAGHDVEVTIWFALYGPAGMAPATVATLNGHVNEILRMPEVQERLRTLGILDGGGPPERLAEMTRRDWERFGRLTREMGISAE